MDSQNKLVGEAVADDPVNELTTDPDEERREDVSTDPDEERVSTDPDEERATVDDNRRVDAGVTSPVLRRFDEEPLRVSDGKSAGGSSATTVALPKDGAWKELPNSLHFDRIEAATVAAEGGACSHAASFIF